MLNDQEKLKLIKEALKDWRNGFLSNDATLMAISLVVTKQPPLTKAEIKMGKEIAKKLKEKNKKIELPKLLTQYLIEKGWSEDIAMPVSDIYENGIRVSRSIKEYMSKNNIEDHADELIEDVKKWKNNRKDKSHDRKTRKASRVQSNYA